MPSNEREYSLFVPIDLSAIDDVEAGHRIKVAMRTRDGAIQSELLQLDGKGDPAAVFGLDEPMSVQIAVGPADAGDDEIFGLQTLTRHVSIRQWRQGPELKLEPLRVTPYFWYFWLRWCRTFVVRGRVVCPDGNPAPGVTVCAYDVDWFWWWRSRQEVACATTDATGSFVMEFSWCCGWWPWWWWRHRTWQLSADLAEMIVPHVQRELGPERILPPAPRPDLRVFERILDDDIGDDLRTDAVELRRLDLVGRSADSLGTTTFDPTLLEEVRERLAVRVPRMPGLEHLRIWPWYPWQPWWDCTPDLIFRATQQCGGEERVVVDESWWDTRWDVPTELDVTLTAHDACCIDPGNDPEGDCVVLSNVCSVSVADIGGNVGAPPAPVGYANPSGGPGPDVNSDDRPFAGLVRLIGQFGDATDIDYYEFEWWDAAAMEWKQMPSGAALGFTRRFWGTPIGVPVTPVPPPEWNDVSFAFDEISGRRVIKSRQRFEQDNEPATWGHTRHWTDNRDLLVRWWTSDDFVDDTYHLRLKGWELDSDGELTNERILPTCNTDDDNRLVLTLDNRQVGLASGHPTTPSHPCTGVHECTTEPDTDVIAVRVGGQRIDPCDTISIRAGGLLEVDFLAHDPDGHLLSYDLRAHYGENGVVNLLAQPSSSLSALSAGAFVGPGYAAARAQGAVAPDWPGGTFRLQVATTDAFPTPCAYLLRLRAYKRTIVNCAGHYVHRNVSEYSFTVVA